MTSYGQNLARQGDLGPNLAEARTSKDFVSRHPANMPPSYGLNDVPWAWGQGTLADYQARLKSFRELETQLKKNPHLHVTDLSGERWGAVVHALFQSFDLQAQLPQTLGQLAVQDQVLGTSTCPDRMTSSGLIYERKTGARQFGAEIADFASICDKPIDGFGIHVPRYMDESRWPLQNRNLLGLATDDVHYVLLLLKGELSSQFTFKLVPDQPGGVNHPGYFEFYKRLAELGLPAEFDIRGDRSLREVYLRRYNPLHYSEPKVSLLPQFAIPSLEAENSKPVEALDNWEFVSYQNSFLYGELIELQRGKEPLKCKLQLTDQDGFSITVDHIQYIVTDERKAREFFAAARERSFSIESHDILGFCEKPKASFARERMDFGVIDELRKVMGTNVINCDTNEIDIGLTLRFNRIVSDLESRGAMILKWASEEIRSFYKHLSVQQKDAISGGIAFYFVDALRRGQLPDFNGLDNVYGVIGETSLTVPPELADKLRWMYDNVPGDVVMNIALSINHEGYVTYGAMHLRVASDKEREASRLPRFQTELPEFVKSVDVSYTQYQEKLKARLLEYVQEKVPHASITEEILFDIKANAEILLTMHGRSSLYDKVDPQLAVLLVSLLEYSVGLQLDGLRDALSRGSYRSRELLERLPGPETGWTSLNEGERGSLASS